MTGFDEWRAAQETGGPRTVNFAGRDWTIPTDMPWALADFTGAPKRTYVHLSNAAHAVFDVPAEVKGKPVDQWAEFEAQRFTKDEVNHLLAFDVFEAYQTPAGDAAPKSGGSTKSRAGTSTP